MYAVPLPRPSRVALAAALCCAGAAHAAGALPTGGQITAGSGSLVRQGNGLVVQQQSQRLVTDWQSFSIAPGASVRFVQPSRSSVALNRVTGSDVSLIQGSLQANGQVFLLNPNGVLFSPGAQVDVGGLVASTLSLRNDDFLAGRYRLAGGSGASVSNAGSIQAPGGGVVLIAARVDNSGSIQADGGAVVLASASDVTLDLGAPVKLQIHRGAFDSQVNQGGVLQADGGTVLLTARAADELTRSVINSQGTVRARTLATGEQGEILLLGDMGHGRLEVAGRLDASAPAGGHGGFIETSAAQVALGQGLQVDAGASRGHGGHGGQWLVDPYDYTIDANAAASIAGSLNNGTSVTVSTQMNVAGQGSAGSAAGNGDITVAAPIGKTAGGDATLTLRADRNIFVNAPITASSGALGITLSAANDSSSSVGGVSVGANLLSNGGRILIGGAGGNAIASQSFGIGYALNPTANDPAVKLGTGITIGSAGGNITINGRTTASANSYSGSKGGIYVLSGATVDSGGGFLYMSAISAGSAKQFAFGVEANSGTVTTFRTSATSGGIVVDALNTLDPLGSLGLVNNGGQAKVQFWAPNVAYFLFRLNGNNQAATFTQSPPCNPGYPNCGTMVIPGGNQSYTSAGYNVKQPQMLPLYVFTGNGSKTYDGSTTATGVNVTSLGGPGGFNVAQLGTLGFRTSSKNVGSYDILTGDAGNPSTYGGNYAVAYFNQGSYAISPRSLGTLQAASKVYDGTTAAAVSASGLVPGDNATVTASGGFAQAGVGNGITVNVTAVSLTGPDAGNYTVPAFNGLSTTANITPAPLTVTAHAASKTYDGLAYSGGNGVSYSGFVNNEGSGVLGGALAYGGSSQGAVNAGTYAITPQGLLAVNYTISYVAAPLTVNPATLTYTADAASRTYGAANPLFTGSVSGFVHGETLATATTGSATFSSTAGAGTGVGSHAIDGAGLSAVNGNYVFAQAAGNAGALSITPAALTVAANAASKTYDGLAYSGGNGVSYSGFVNGEGSGVISGTLSYGGSSQGAVNAGTYAVTPQGLTAGNYTLSYVAAPLTVNPATLTYTADAASRTYGAANPTFTGSVSGFVHGETLASATTGTAAFTTTAATGSHVGSYALTGGGLTANNGNYVFAQATGNVGALAITPAPLMVTANADSKTYDGQAYGGGNGVSYSGFVNGEGSGVLSGTLSYGGSSQGAVNAGTYAITPQGLSAGNYALSFHDGQLTVLPAPIVVVPVPPPAPAPAPAPSPAPSPAPAPTPAPAPSPTPAPAPAPTPAPLPTQIAGELTGGTSKVYDGSSLALLTPANYLLTGFVGTDGVMVTQSRGQYDDASAGTGKRVTATLGAGDFQATGSTLLSNYLLPTQVSGNIGTITPAPLTVTAGSTTRTYDGQAYAGGAGITVTGLVSGESTAVLGGTLGFGGSSQGAVNAGRYTITPQGLTAANYAIRYVDGSLAIDPATLVITADAATRAAGSANSAYTGRVSGFVPGDTLANATTGQLSFSSPAGSTSTEGRYAIVGSGLVANHGNYVFVQDATNTGALSITAPQAVAQAFLPRTTAVPNFPDNALPALGTTSGPVSFGDLNYVPVKAQPNAAEAGPANGTRAAKTGSAGIAVPSANGPLDVFVMEGGINLGADNRRP